MTTPSKHLKRFITIFALLLIVFLFHNQATAQYATGGSGIYRNNIHWFVWGTEGSTLSSGTSRSYTAASGSSTFTITCTISNFSSGATFYAYRPGTWQGDGIDNLYNIGGVDSSNTFVNAISVPNASTYSLRYTCNSVLNGSPYTLPGIIFADAEQADSSINEYIQGTALSGGTWRIIDRYRDCSASQVGLLTGTTLRISGISPNCNQGPMSVAYLDGGSSIDATVKGRGISAIAVGVSINQDFGDAPSSYGTAVHLNSPTWSGGTLTPSTNTNINDSAFTLGTIGTSTLRLGATIDYESDNQPNATATGDDSTTSPGTDDEDGVTLSATVTRGKTISVPVVVNGNGRLNAWFDWNQDGDFADSGEQVTNDQSVSTGTTTLSIPVPATATTGTSYARFRLCSTAGACNTPNSIAANGEVEDYSLTIVSPSLSITKTSNGPWTVAQSGANYTLTAANNGGISTFGTITVQDSLPTGMTPNWSGTNTVTNNGITWACTFSGQNITCTTSNIISNTGTNSSQITLPVNVTTSSPIGTNAVTNYASIGGGGDYFNGGTVSTPGTSCTDTSHCASNSTTVNSPNLSILKSHSGSFVRGGIGSYNLMVNNSGTAAASGTITVIDNLPIGLTVADGAVTLSGTNAANWSCNAATNVITCTSTTVIATSGSSVFSFNVNVSLAAGNSVTNTATVSGGGEATVNSGNNSATDATTIITPISCGKVYASGFGADRNSLYELNGSTMTPIYTAPQIIGGLAVSANGSAYYDDGTFATPPLYRFDGSNQTNTGITLPTLLVGEAADAAGNIYYIDASYHLRKAVAGSSGIASDLGAITFDAGDTIGPQLRAGDMAIDGNGRIYWYSSINGTGKTYLYIVNPTTLVAKNMGDVGPDGGSGAAFDGSGRFITTSSSGQVYVINLSSSNLDGIVIGTASPTVYDLGSCANPLLNPILTVTKSVANLTKNQTPAVNAQSADILEYTVVVTNNGNLQTFDAALADAIPTGTTYLANSTTLNGVSVADISGAMPYAASNEIYSIGQPSGVVSATSTVTVKFRVTLNADSLPTTIDNTATTTYPTISGGITTVQSINSNTTKTPVIILPPNVSLLKSCPTPANCTTAPQSPGTDLTYKIAYTNSGGQGALNMIIVDAIPAATDYKLGSAAANLGTTGLTLVIEYSSDYDPLNPTVATWNYTPVSGGGGASAGYDRRVKAVRWRVIVGTLSNISPTNIGDVSFIAKIR